MAEHTEEQQRQRPALTKGERVIVLRIGHRVRPQHPSPRTATTTPASIARHDGSRTGSERVTAAHALRDGELATPDRGSVPRWGRRDA